MTGAVVWLVVAAAVLAAVAVGVLVARGVNTPREDLRPQPGGPGDSTSDRAYRGVDRPAGPDAESMDPQVPSRPERPPA